MIHIGPNEAIKSLADVTFPSASAAPVTYILDSSSTAYQVPKTNIYGNVTIEAADPNNKPKMIELFHQAMEIWLPELPDIQLVQNFHRIPMNTTYWKNWPTAENPYVNGASWHLTYPIVLWNLQPA